MNKDIFKLNNDIINNIISLKNDINYNLDNYPKMSDEDTSSYYNEVRMYQRLEKFLTDLDSILYDLKRFASQTKIGKLEFVQENKSFRIKDTNKYIHIGDEIEILNEELKDWEPGKILYSDNYKNMYFLSYDTVPKDLKEGMTIRVDLSN